MLKLNRSLRSLLFCLVLSLLAGARGTAQNLDAEVIVKITGPVWEYTLVNNEPAGSSNWISGFYLPLYAPISDVKTPDFWSVDTDFLTYINWQNRESSPFPHDIAPGETLAGFGFESRGRPKGVDYELFSYDHVADDLGPNGFGPTLAPQLVPEANTLLLFGAGLVFLIPAVRRTRKA